MCQIGQKSSLRSTASRRPPPSLLCSGLGFWQGALRNGGAYRGLLILYQLPTVGAGPLIHRDSFVPNMSHVHQKEPITEPVPLYDDEKALRRRGVNGVNRHDDLRSDRFTAGNILRGEVGHALPATAYERKASLINMELDKLGFGRYQACIWFLCGFGYMLDLMFAQAVGLVAEPI